MQRMASFFHLWETLFYGYLFLLIAGQAIFLEGDAILKIGTNNECEIHTGDAPPHTVRISPDPEQQQMHAEDDLHGPTVTWKKGKGGYLAPTEL